MNENLPDNPQIQVLKSGTSGLFTNYIYKAIPLAFDESMSYYETLCGLLNYLKNVIIPTVNNNADAVAELQSLYEQLKSYVDDYFTNLDVQDEINNKLDEMVIDGTLENIISQYINTKFKNELNQAFITPNYLTTLELPENHYAQSCCTDGIYIYLFTTSGSTYACTRFNLSNYEKIDTVDLGSGHANSCCYYKNHIYVCNFTNMKQIDVYDTSLNLIKHITLTDDVRGFSIYESVQGDLIVCYQQYNTGQFRYFQIMDNYKLEPLNIINTPQYKGNRNGIKPIFINDVDFIAYCIGESGDNTMKGNIVIFNLPNQKFFYDVALENMGTELQDIFQNGRTNTLYVINSAGALYSFNGTDVMPSSIAGGIYRKGIYPSLTSIVYSGYNALDTKIQTNGAGDTKYSLTTQFMVPKNQDCLIGSFMNGQTCITCLSESVYNVINNPGAFRVPINRQYKYNNNLYILSGVALYGYSAATNTNINSNGTYGKYTLSMNSSVFQLTTINVSTNTTTHQQYTLENLITYMNENNLGFILSNLYPVVIYSMPNYFKNSAVTMNNVEDWITFE